MSKETYKGNLFCFGLGFTAKTLARSLISKNWLVSGTSRNPNLNDTLKKNGVSVYLYDGNQVVPEISDAIQSATHILISIPPQSSGDIVLQQFGADFLNWDHLKWIGYISSTGVYGDAKGEWVDETSPLKPVTTHGSQRLVIESSWLKMHKKYDLPVVVFRCAGIYGSGRNLLLTIKQGRARKIKKPGHVFSRIHVEDLAQTLEASMQSPQPGEIYNVSDDCPSCPSETLDYACGLLNIEPPAPVLYENAELTDMARSFYQANKRVSNKKIKKELHIKLQYPDFRVGLSALIQE